MLLLTTLFLFTPLKIHVKFRNGLELLKVSFGFLHLTLFPFKAKRKKAAKPSRKAAPAKKRELPFELSSVSDALRFARRASGKALKKIVVERFDLSLTIAAEDPAKTGILYGQASMASGILLPLFDGMFHVRERTVNIRADFSMTKPEVSVDTVIFTRPVQMLLVGSLLIFHLPVKIKKRKKDKAVSVS